MNKYKRIEKISKRHFEILDILEMYFDGELRTYGDMYRLVDKEKNPKYNFKYFYIFDLIEHGYLKKEGVRFTIIKN